MMAAETQQPPPTQQQSGNNGTAASGGNTAPNANSNPSGGKHGLPNGILENKEPNSKGGGGAGGDDPAFRNHLNYNNTNSNANSAGPPGISGGKNPNNNNGDTNSNNNSAGPPNLDYPGHYPAPSQGSHYPQHHPGSLPPSHHHPQQQQPPPHHLHHPQDPYYQQQNYQHRFPGKPLPGGGIPPPQGGYPSMRGYPPVNQPPTGPTPTLNELLKSSNSNSNSVNSGPPSSNSNSSNPQTNYRYPYDQNYGPPIPPQQQHHPQQQQPPPHHLKSEYPPGPGPLPPNASSWPPPPHQQQQQQRPPPVNSYGQPLPPPQHHQQQQQPMYRQPGPRPGLPIPQQQGYYPQQQQPGYPPGPHSPHYPPPPQSAQQRYPPPPGARPVPPDGMNHSPSPQHYNMPPSGLQPDGPLPPHSQSSNSTPNATMTSTSTASSITNSNSSSSMNSSDVPPTNNNSSNSNSSNSGPGPGGSHRPKSTPPPPQSPSLGQQQQHSSLPNHHQPPPSPQQSSRTSSVGSIVTNSNTNSLHRPPAGPGQQQHYQQQPPDSGDCNSNDSNSGGAGGGAGSGGGMQRSSPTGSAGSRSMSPAVGNNPNIPPMPPRPSSSQSDGNSAQRQSPMPQGGQYPPQQQPMAPPPHHMYPPGGKYPGQMIPPGAPPGHYPPHPQQHWPNQPPQGYPQQGRPPAQYPQHGMMPGFQTANQPGMPPNANYGPPPQTRQGPGVLPSHYGNYQPPTYGGPVPQWAMPQANSPHNPPAQTQNIRSQTPSQHVKHHLQQKLAGYPSPPHQGNYPMGPPPSTPPPPQYGGHLPPPSMPPHHNVESMDTSNSNSNLIGPDGIPLDDASQHSTASGASGGDDGPKSKRDSSHPSYPNQPPTPHAAPSPGGGSLNSMHDEYGDGNSPGGGWPRTPASPVLNSHPPPSTDQFKSKVKKPDSLTKLYEMDNNPERRVFLDKLLKYMDDHGTPITACPTISKQPLDLFKMYYSVKERGGFLEVTKNKAWKDVAAILSIGASSSAAYTLRKHYTKHLLPFECKFDRGGIDPIPLINQVESSSKKKGPGKAAPVPSPGSSNSQDSFQGAQTSTPVPNNAGSTGNTPNSSMDGFPAYPPSGPYGNQPSSQAQGQQPPPSITPSDYPGVPPNASSPGVGGPPTPQRQAPPPSQHPGDKVISLTNPFDDMPMPANQFIQPYQHLFLQTGHIPGSKSYYPAYSSSVPPSGYQGPPPGNYPSYSGPPDQYSRGPPSQPHEYQQQPYGSQPPSGYPVSPQARSMYPYGSAEGGAPPTQSPQQRGSYPYGPGPNESAAGPAQPPASSPQPGRSYPYGSAEGTTAQSQPPPASPQARSYPYGSGEQGPSPSPSPQQRSMYPYGPGEAGPQGQPATPSHHSQQPGHMQQHPQDPYFAQQHLQYRFPGKPGGMPSQAYPRGYPPQAAQQPSTGPTASFNDLLKAPVSSASVSPSGNAPPTTSASVSSSQPGYRYPYDQNFGPTMAQQTPPHHVKSDYPASGPVPSNAGGGWPHQQQRPPPQQGAQSPPWPAPHQRSARPPFPSMKPDMYKSYSGAGPMIPPSNAGSSHVPSAKPPNSMLSSQLAPINQMASSMALSSPTIHCVPQPTPFSQTAMVAPPMPIKKEIVFPPDSVEAVTPVFTRRRKLQKNDVAPVEPWRIVMCLKSGLLAETTWALDVLNVLLYDDQTISYFSLSYLPGLLDLMLEHFRRSLILVFGEPVDLDVPIPAITDKDINTKVKGKRRKWYEISSKNNEEDDDVDLGSPLKKFPKNGVRTVILSSTNYTMKSRITDKEVGIVAKDDELFVLPGPRDWDIDEKLRSDPNLLQITSVSSSTMELTRHFVTNFTSDLNIVPIINVLKDKGKDNMENQDNCVESVIIKTEPEEVSLNNDNESTTATPAPVNLDLYVCEVKYAAEMPPKNKKSPVSKQKPAEVPIMPANNNDSSSSQQLRSLLEGNTPNSNNLVNSDKLYCKNSLASAFKGKMSRASKGKKLDSIVNRIKSKDPLHHEQDDESPLNLVLGSKVAKSEEVIANSCSDNAVTMDQSTGKVEDSNPTSQTASTNHNSSETSSSENCDNSTKSEPNEPNTNSSNEKTSQKDKVEDQKPEVKEETNPEQVISTTPSLPPLPVNAEGESSSDSFTIVQTDSGVNVRIYGSCAKRRRLEDFEDECYTRDEASLNNVTETQDYLARRMLAISNILRNFTFVPGNDVEVGKNPHFLGLLGKLILLHHDHPLKGKCKASVDIAPVEAKSRLNSTEKDASAPVALSGGEVIPICEDEDDELFNLVDEPNSISVSAGVGGPANDLDADSCTSLNNDEEWWWNYIHYIREDVLVIIANISGQVDLSLYSEEISRPILDGLLHWAICPAAYGQDPFPSISPTSHAMLTPQRLAIEALCKLCVTQGNVDLLLATPPYSRIERLSQLLSKWLCRHEDQVLREFAVNLLSYLSGADSGIARTIAQQNPCISLLISFIEQAEQNALNIANNHGFSILRENPEAMGTSLDMLRRAASTLLNLSRHPDNRALFVQHEPRLLNLVMSQILEQKVAAIVAQVLYQCSSSDSSGSGHGGGGASSFGDSINDFYTPSMSRSRIAPNNC